MCVCVYICAHVSVCARAYEAGQCVRDKKIRL